MGSGSVRSPLSPASGCHPLYGSVTFCNNSGSRGRKSWGSEGSWPLPWKYVGWVGACLDPLKCHILSLKTVVGQLCKPLNMKDERLVSKMEGKTIFRGSWNSLMAWPDWPRPPDFTTDLPCCQFLTACRRLKELVLSSTFDTSLSSFQ